MAEKEQQAYHPPTANGYTRNNDAEAAAAMDPHKLRRKKRIKCAIYIVAFIIFQIGVITIFSVTVMKARTPKFRVRAITSSQNTEVTTPPISINMNVQFEVKNNNFGPYKYDNTIVEFLYKGVNVGNATVPKSKAGFRSSKKINVDVNLVIQASSDLTSDLGNRSLPLTIHSRLSGKIELIFLFKKKKATTMNCNMVINTNPITVQNLVC